MNNNKNGDNFKLKSGEIVEMNQDEVARWCCLIEAIDVVSKKGMQVGIDMNSNSWVKPIAFQKYIDDRMDTMVEEIQRDQDNLRVTVI